MGYYRGDYYRGDGGNNYYRGDPFLGGLIGGLAAKAGKWAVKRITGSGLKKTAIATVGTGIAIGMPRIPLPGGGSLDIGAALPGGAPLFTPGQCPPGYHLDKRTRSKCVRNRKMNPLNPRALKRGLRRAEGFEIFAKRTMNALYKTVGGTRTRKFKKC